MDQYVRRISGFGIQAPVVDGLRQEGFPYPGLMMQRVAQKLPDETLTFYTSAWIAKTNEKAPGW